MNKVIRVTPHFAVTGALSPADYAEARRLGFRAIVSNLPDGESTAHPTSEQARELAREAGLTFRHIPATKFDVLSESVLDDMQDALAAIDGPVLAHCASGFRSALAWAGAAARLQPADQVIEALQRAGIDISALRDELPNAVAASAQHIPSTLDVSVALECA